MGLSLIIDRYLECKMQWPEEEKIHKQIITYTKTLLLHEHLLFLAYSNDFALAGKALQSAARTKSKGRFPCTSAESSSTEVPQGLGNSPANSSEILFPSSFFMPESLIVSDDESRGTNHKYWFHPLNHQSRL